MLYLYKHSYQLIVSTDKLFNFNYEFITILNFDITNYNVVFTKYKTHPINTNIIPTRYGFILIIDKDYQLKLFEPFDVLKEYPILDTDYVFEIYKINETTKVFPYPFSFDKFYIQCKCCNDITNEPILQCKNCYKPMCSHCNIFDNCLCDLCNTEDITF